MRKILYNLVLGSAFLIAFFGCQSMLDQRPIDTIDFDRAFENAQDIEAGILGAYAAVGSTFMNVAAIASDEVRRSNENRGQGVQVHNWTLNSTNGESGGWSGYYAIINRVNRVISAIDRLKEAGILSPTEVNRQEAEAYALRAFAHFELWRMYSDKYEAAGIGIPLITLADTDNNGRPDGIDPFFKPSRNTSLEVFTQIESDLSTARQLMPSTATAKNRFNAAAILGISARVALYKEDWLSAESFATDALSIVPLESAARFADIFADASEEGVLLKMTRVIGNERIGSIFRDINGDVFFHPSNNLVGLYDAANDIRYATTIYQDPARNPNTNSNLDPQRTLVRKYIGGAGAVNLNDLKILRSAELVLIRAEARARAASPNLVGANADLNALRSNRISNHVVVDYATSQEIVNEILLERRKELAFEGHRWFDLKRNSLAVTRQANDIHINGTLPADDTRFVLPIPQSEIFANTNVIQNPGYN